MSVIFLLLTVSTGVAGLFLIGFIWAVRRGQYDDDRSPAVRILLDDGVRGEEIKVNGEWSMVNGNDPAFHQSPLANDHSPAHRPLSPALPSHHPAQPVAP